MGFVDQRVYGMTAEERDRLTAEGVYGDCWRACIASVLNLAYEEVPHFLQDYNDDWWTEAAKWSEFRGLWICNMEASRFLEVEYNEEDLVSEYVIAVGVSPRTSSNEYHAVVANTKLEILHDPHPSREGLIGDVLEVDFFIKAEQ